MSEKISEEKVRKIIEAACPAVAGTLLDSMVQNVRAAGLLEPEEDEEERAKNEWEEAALLELDKYKTRSAALKYINILESRLKASAWTDEYVRWYGDYCWQQGRKFNSDIQTPSEWLALRKAGKEAE